jgi:hypothetical protein
MEILSNIDNPRLLERMYRENKAAFKSEFNLLYPTLSNNKLADFWNERLNYESAEISWGSTKELAFVIIASLLAGMVAKIPFIFNLNHDLFYQRYVGFIVFPALTAYFIWKKNLPVKHIVFTGIAFLLPLIYINQLPANDKSDTLMLAGIHLPFVLWAILGFSYLGGESKSNQHRLGFLRYNGDVVIMTGLLGIAGAALTALTIGLFSLIGLDIVDFYFNNIAIFGLAALPVFATYITQSNPQLINKVSPVIAKIFSPLVLIMLVVYLAAIFISGKGPYKDRNFLMVFNLLLVGVMAIIFFSVAETSGKQRNNTGTFILLALSIVTIIVNGIALSAIVLRITEWGITPNRMAVLGINILMLTNLLLVAYRLFGSFLNKTDIREADHVISRFLPVYVLWALVVTFIFPVVFSFK